MEANKSIPITQNSSVILILGPNKKLTDWLFDRITGTGPYCIQTINNNKSLFLTTKAPFLGKDCTIATPSKTKDITIENLKEYLKIASLVLLVVDENSYKDIENIIKNADENLKQLLVTVVLSDKISFIPQEDKKIKLFYINKDNGYGLDNLIFHLRSTKLETKLLTQQKRLKPLLNHFLDYKITSFFMFSLIIVGLLFLSHMIVNSIFNLSSMLVLKLFNAIMDKALLRFHPSSSTYFILFDETFEYTAFKEPSFLFSVVYGTIFLILQVIPKVIIYLILLEAVKKSLLIKKVVFQSDRTLHLLGCHWFNAFSIAKCAGCKIAGYNDILEKYTNKRFLSPMIYVGPPCILQQSVILLYPWGNYTKMILAFFVIVVIWFITAIVIGILNQRPYNTEPTKFKVTAMFKNLFYKYIPHLILGALTITVFTAISKLLQLYLPPKVTAYLLQGIVSKLSLLTDNLQEALMIFALMFLPCPLLLYKTTKKYGIRLTLFCVVISLISSIAAGLSYYFLSFLIST